MFNILLITFCFNFPVILTGSANHWRGGEHVKNIESLLPPPIAGESGMGVGICIIKSVSQGDTTIPANFITTSLVKFMST